MMAGPSSSPMMIEEAKEAFGMIVDQNDDGPPELVANPLNDAVSGGRQSGSYDGYSDSSDELHCHCPARRIHHNDRPS